MFKGKKGAYLLVVINILIWGFFVYRFYSAYHETEVLANVNNLTILKLEALGDSVGYKLNLNYDDPFLKKEPKHVKSNIGNPNPINQQKLAPIIKKPKEEPKKIPEIKYLGLVKNSSSGFVTAIVSIDGKSKIVKQDEIVDGVSFKSFTNESMTVLWNKGKFVISK